MITSNIAVVQNTLQAAMANISAIHVVYGIEHSKPSGFPFATVTFEEIEDEVFTTNANQFYARFSVKIIDEYSGIIEPKINTEDRLLSLLDSTLDVLRNEDYSSFGYDFRPKITAGRPEYIKIGEGEARKIELTVELTEKVEITSLS